ncbi:uncharacterized protein KY384_006610 [Bacidia gigantensis]|uniref:uncharacterized protein n=1 Tax=Bacidia gigantensis TaxID=2732470 RepID=UPI001D04DA6D|nr:uncharacterized protein KY384_006610 [Bacidia gigantensis]KAG8528921.1 hypothetical protein KY384_006610 [Bacidia gigantensis]
MVVNTSIAPTKSQLLMQLAGDDLPTSTSTLPTNIKQLIKDFKSKHPDTNEFLHRLGCLRFLAVRDLLPPAEQALIDSLDANGLELAEYLHGLSLFRMSAPPERADEEIEGRSHHHDHLDLKYWRKAEKARLRAERLSGTVQEAGSHEDSMHAFKKWLA